MKSPEAGRNQDARFSWLEIPKSIWYFLGENRPRYLFFTILLLTILFYDLVPAYIAGKIVDFFSNYHHGDSLRLFYEYVIFLGITYAIISVIRLTAKNRLTQIAIITKTRARILGFERLVNYPLSWHAQENTGNKIQRIFDGANALSGFASLVNQTLFPIIASFVGVVAIFLFLSPVFALFAVVYISIFLSIQASFNKKLSELSNKSNTLNQAASGVYFESSNNILSIKALGSEKNISAHVQTTEENSKLIQIRRSILGTRKWYSFQIFNGIAYTAFFLLVGHQILAGVMTVGEILIFYSYFAKLRDSMNDTNDTINSMIQFKSDLANMMPIFTHEVVKTGNEKFPEAWNSIVIENASFTYPNGHEALTGVNFQIKEFERLGIAGESGSGKSTFIKILLGLYPFKNGSFRVGNKNYYDINHDELIKHIAVVLQETELFNLSLKDNITGLRDVDQKTLARAIDISGLTSVLEHLPGGLDTLIGEKGYKLSGGERQRVGIARAICKDTPIVILDEATSALDSKTEKEVLSKLFSSFGEKKTFISIAHRISTLRDTDRVIVFDKGSVVEDGSYDELIHDKNSKLGQLYQLQSKK
jgi:ABC-type multidrug transport system fused ATPase/permease subunit